MALWHGCAMVHSRYPQRQVAQDIFQYSVDAIIGIGFSTTMSYANSGFAQDYDGQNFGGTPTNFTQLLQSTPYAYLFGTAIPRHAIQLWTFANGTQSDPPALQLTTTQLANEYTEIYNACVYLLTTYSNKEFIIKNWEGDWQLLGDFDPLINIPSMRPERYAAFAATRQRAVRDARRDTPSTSVVKYAVELNRCLDDYGHRLHRDVLDLVKPDMVGWSAYEAINYWYEGWTRVAPAIYFGSDEIRAMAINGQRVVVVGTGGKASLSTNGAATFGPVDVGFSSSDINAVKWLAGLNVFLAVGAGGKISTSPDGVTWTPRTSGVATELKGFIYNGTNQLIAFGASSVVLTSANATTWAAATWTGGTPTTTWMVGSFTAGSWYLGGTLGIGAAGFGTSVQQFTINFSTETVRAIQATDDGFGIVFGGDNGKISYATIFDSSATAATSQFGTDAILGLAFGQNKFVAVGTNGKISTGDASGVSWTARTSGTGAYLNACTYSTTEDAWAYGCDGATGYSLDGTTWIVNGQGAMGGLNVNPGCMLSADKLTITGADNGVLTTARFWHAQRNATFNIDYYMREGVARIRRMVPAGTPIAITEYGFPQDQTNFTGGGLTAGPLIQQVIDTATALNLAGVIWWQIFDNEEQSPGVTRGFHLYARNANATTPGALSPAGVKYDAIL